MIRFGLVATATGVALALTGCTHPNPPTNRAAVDVTRTSEVLDAAKEDVRNALTVRGETAEQRRNRVAPYVTKAGGEAVDGGLLAHDLATAKTTPMTVDYTITETAVSELIGDRASVLIAGAKVQVDTTTFKEARTLLVGLQLKDGAWRIDSVKVNPTWAHTMPPIQATDSLETERDSAISAAASIAGTLTEDDASDPQNTRTRWLAVSTALLADRLRALSLDDVKHRGGRHANMGTSFGAASAIEPGKATVLVLVQATNADDGAWQARDFREVDTI